MSIPAGGFVLGSNDFRTRVFTQAQSKNKGQMTEDVLSQMLELLGPFRDSQQCLASMRQITEGMGLIFQGCLAIQQEAEYWVKQAHQDMLEQPPNIQSALQHLDRAGQLDLSAKRIGHEQYAMEFAKYAYVLVQKKQLGKARALYSTLVDAAPDVRAVQKLGRWIRKMDHKQTRKDAPLPENPAKLALHYLRSAQQAKQQRQWKYQQTLVYAALLLPFGRGHGRRLSPWIALNIVS